MRSLIDKFYSYSATKRLLAVITWLIILSVASSVYSFINLSSQLRSMGEEAKSFKGFENIPAYSNPIYLDQLTLEAFSSWKTLKDFAEKLLLNPEKDKPMRLSDEVEANDSKIIETIRSFNNLDWKHLSLFTTSQTDPFNGELAESFKKIRQVSRFLALYQIRFKNQFPQENSSFMFSANVKLARMNDLSSPFLIGKMITIAVDGIALKGLLKLFQENKLSAEEISDCLQVLHLSLILDKSMKTAMEDEFLFFKHVYGRLYAKATLALWILEKIHGDPFAQYQQLNRQMFENPEFKLEMNFMSHNPVLMIAFPNFRKANQVYNEKRAHKTILATIMSQQTAQPEVLKDPYSGEPLKSLLRDEKKVFYSIGPDKIDNQATGDDITLPADLEF